MAKVNIFLLLFYGTNACNYYCIDVSIHGPSVKMKYNNYLVLDKGSGMD